MTKRINRRALLVGFFAMPVLVACGGTKRRRRRGGGDVGKVKADRLSPGSGGNIDPRFRFVLRRNTIRSPLWKVDRSQTQ